MPLKKRMKVKWVKFRRRWEFVWVWVGVEGVCCVPLVAVPFAFLVVAREDGRVSGR